LNLFAVLAKSCPEKIREHLHRRTTRQPLDLPSAGSVFKNPPAGPAAGKLIEEAGLFDYLRAGVYLSGGGARIPQVAQLAESVLGLPVFVGRSNSLSGLKSALDQPEFATAIGLDIGDANGDGFPDPGATPLMTITNMTGTSKRVPILR
jgi:hypothetical protein